MDIRDLRATCSRGGQIRDFFLKHAESPTHGCGMEGVNLHVDICAIDTVSNPDLRYISLCMPPVLIQHGLINEVQVGLNVKSEG